MSDSESTGIGRSGGKRYGCLLYSLSFLAVVGLLVSLAYFAWYSGARSELEAGIARIRERGEPLWFSEIAPKDEELEHDATPLYFLALEKLQPPNQAFHDLVSADPPTQPADYPALASVLAANQESLAWLRQATRQPNFRLPLDYQTKTPISLTLMPIQNARDFARLLQGDVIQSLGTGNHARAVAAIEEILGLSELLRDEPFAITQLVRIAIGSIAQASLEQTVAAIDLTPEQFAALDQQLEAIESQFSLKQSLIAERCMAFTTMENLADNANLSGLVRASPDPMQVRSLRLLNSGFMRPNLMADEAFMLRIMAQVIEHVDETGPAGHEHATALENQIQTASNRYVLTKLLMPAVAQLRNAGLRYRQKLITARLGIRVDRYFANHGEFPQSLEDITDERLKTVPVDLYSGKPVIYKVLPTGFVIYPVGINGVDDGGSKSQDDVEFFSNFEVHYQ